MVSCGSSIWSRLPRIRSLITCRATTERRGNRGAMNERNEQIVLARRPEGIPRPEDFRIESASMPVPSAGEVLVRTIHISLDPYLRGRMAGPLPYATGYELDQPMDSDVTAQVVASRDPAFKDGDYVLGDL